jgi:hypothetical protein
MINRRHEDRASCPARQSLEQTLKESHELTRLLLVKAELEAFVKLARLGADGRRKRLETLRRAWRSRRLKPIAPTPGSVAVGVPVARLSCRAMPVLRWG